MLEVHKPVRIKVFWTIALDREENFVCRILGEIISACQLRWPTLDCSNLNGHIELLLVPNKVFHLVILLRVTRLTRALDGWRYWKKELLVIYEIVDLGRLSAWSLLIHVVGGLVLFIIAIVREGYDLLV